MLSTRQFSLPRWCFSLLVSLAAQAAPAAEAAFGPLFQQFKLTLDPGHRTEYLGPLYYEQELGEEDKATRVWAAPPLFSYSLNQDVDYELFDFLWKGITYRRFGDEYRWQILELLNFAGGSTQSETNVHRTTLFPLYFQQRSAIPEKNYTALVPVYGTLKQRLFRDEIRFVLFPLYGRTRKRDVVTANYLYPIFHLRHGDGLSGWQVWPLIGAEHKATSTNTNRWGDPEVSGGHHKLFVFWPFFFNQRTGLGTDNPAHQQALVPFYNYLRSPQRDSTSYLWPLGVTRTDDREKKYVEWGTPWPLVVFARGAGKTTTRVWPLFSHAHNATQSSDWYLWPVYKYNRLHSDPLDRERTRVLFFLYSDVSVRNTETGGRLREIDLWPLFTSRRNLEGRNRLQVLSVLEPFLPNNSSVERNLSPLWSVWRSEQNVKSSATSQSLLWNLYRRDTTRESKKCSLLFGLFQYQSGPEGRHWRVCYLSFGKSKPADEPASR